jgi:hypothetical protein
MRPDHRAVDKGQVPVEWPGGVALLLDSPQETRPHASLAPTGKPAGNGAPRAIACRQITPGGAGTKNPQDTIEETTMINSRATCRGFLGGE